MAVNVLTLNELTNNKLTVGHENDNLRWVHEGVQGYKHIFNGI